MVTCFSYRKTRGIVKSMKRFSIFIFSVFLVLPLLSFAHTSDERYVDGYVVDLSTAPIAPWVGEKMGMSFAFLDPKNFHATETVAQATLEIDALFRTNRKPQEVIYRSPIFTVKDGSFATSYIFAEEGTYDLHLTFTDTSGKTHIAGYRKQIRHGAPEAKAGATPQVFFSTIILLTMLSFVAGVLWKKNSGAQKTPRG